MMSINVRGLNERVKRRKLFRWVKNNRADICFVQEAHSTADQEKIWRSEWGGTILFSHGTSRARGVAILIKPGFDISIIDLYQDSVGRFVIVDAKIQDTSFKLVNIYAPNSEENQINFYHHLRKKMKDNIDATENIKIGGDWNVIQNTLLDRKGGVEIKDSDKRKLVLNELELIREIFHICDIWRVKNPNNKRFTWRKKNPVVKSRLDFCTRCRYCPFNKYRSLCH